MEKPNTNTVFVVQADTSKDFSDAKRYGSLRAVFGRPRKPYDTGALVARARRVLSDWKDGDHLLMIGDPTLCAVCMSVITEEFDTVKVLSWDREIFSYIPQDWDFGQLSFDFGDTED
jgi:hypothetical protein